MAITNGNRKLLDPKRWEFMCLNPIGNTVDGSVVASSRHHKQRQFFIYNATNVAMYNPEEDGWVYLPNPSFSNWGIGACAITTSWSTGNKLGVSSLSAIGGSVSSIQTDQFFARELSGYDVHILEGPNAGKFLEIKSTSVGPSSILTFDVQPSAFDSTTRFRLLTPRVYGITNGTIASGTSFKFYDFATNTWVGLAVAGFHTSVGTDARLIATPSLDYNDLFFHSFVATAANSNQIENSSANWAASSWSNYQIRIASGTGAGQIYPIATNDASTLTISGTWAITPSTDSSAVLEGCDDFLYYIGNNSVALYRYRISTNTWSLITPTVARLNTPANGLGGNWVHSVTDPTWNDPNNIKNGRYIYSFRANSTGGLDIYDIALNRWENNHPYAPGFVGAVSGTLDTFSTGTKYCYNKNFIYITKENSGRFFKFDIHRREMIPWGFLMYPQSTVRTGDTLFDVMFKEGNTELTYMYFIPNSLNSLFRCMDI